MFILSVYLYLCNDHLNETKKGGRDMIGFKRHEPLSFALLNTIKNRTEREKEFFLC